MAITSVTQTPSGQGLTDIAGLLKSLTGEREQKYGQGLQVLQQLADLMAGPEFGKYAEEMYESARRKAVGGGVSRLISSGMAGTTRMLEPERGFEREVGTPFRLGMAEQRAGRIGGAMERISDYIRAGTPEAGTLAYLATGGFGALTPEQKMAMQEFPYLMQAAQAGGAGGTTVGGGGGYLPSYGGGGIFGTTGGVTGGTTGGGWQPTPGGTLATAGIQMAGGYGPAFQSPEQLAQAGAGQFTPVGVGAVAGAEAAPTGERWITPPGSKSQYKVQGDKVLGIKTGSTYAPFRTPMALSELTWAKPATKPTAPKGATLAEAWPYPQTW